MTKGNWCATHSESCAAKDSKRRDGAAVSDRRGLRDRRGAGNGARAPSRHIRNDAGEIGADGPVAKQNTHWKTHIDLRKWSAREPERELPSRRCSCVRGGK